MPKIKIESETNPLFHQEGDLKKKLDHSSGKNTDGQRHHRLLKGMIKKEDRGDDGYIEKDRSNCWGEEMAKGVQDSHAKGEEPHEKEIREDDLVEDNGELKFLWNSYKPRGNDSDQNR